MFYEELTEDEILELLESRGLLIDDGCVIGGPFIPDGRYRIYDEDYTILGEGSSLRKAYEELG